MLPTNKKKTFASFVKVQVFIIVTGLGFINRKTLCKYKMYCITPKTKGVQVSFSVQITFNVTV